MRRYAVQRSKQGSARGDTIVEVLIAIAIVSSVLAGAFSVTQKSTIAVRSSQERSEMLQLLQGQVELVRSIAVTAKDKNDEIYSTSPKYFCIDSVSRTRSAFASMSNEADYGNKCKKLGSGNLYRLAVTYNDSSKVFTFFGSWDKIGGGSNTMNLFYRISPGTIAIAPPLATPPPPPPAPKNCTAVNDLIKNEQDIFVMRGALIKDVPFAGQLRPMCKYRLTLLYGDTHPAQKARGDDVYKELGESFRLEMIDSSSGAKITTPATPELPDFFPPGPPTVTNPNNVEGGEAQPFVYEFTVPAGVNINKIQMVHAQPNGQIGSIHMYEFTFQPIP